MMVSLPTHICVTRPLWVKWPSAGTKRSEKSGMFSSAFPRPSLCYVIFEWRGDFIQTGRRDFQKSRSTSRFELYTSVQCCGHVVMEYKTPFKAIHHSLMFKTHAMFANWRDDNFSVISIQEIENYFDFMPAISNQSPISLTWFNFNPNMNKKLPSI